VLTTRNRITELDALRGIAALSVVLYHFTMGRAAGNFVFSTGCMGVDLFFVISGFVIFLTVNKTPGIKAFAWNRFSRLYPAYWVAVSFTTVLILLNTQSLYYQKETYEVTNNLLVKYAANMSMLQYYFKINNIDGPYWTLIIELLFYCIVLLLMVTKKIKYIEQIGFGLLLLCACYAFDAFTKTAAAHFLFVAFPLVKYFPLFFGGIILYNMKFKKITAFRIVAFLLTLVIQCALFKNCYHNTVLVSSLQYTITLCCIYAIFFLFLFNKLGFIINPVTKWLGKISYSLYLIHQYVGTAILIPFFTSELHLPFWPSCILSIAIVLVLAHSINKYVEQPALKYFRKFRSLPMTTAMPVYT